jgi:hypothetical protein
MLVQDSLTGYVHDVPDQNVAGYGGYGQVVYDGLGNPVGTLGGPFDFITNAVKGIASNIPIVGGLVNSLLPGSSPAPPMPLPFPPNMASSMYPGASPYPVGPLPPGWVRPMGPVTGSNRLYLRCSTWPGPPGLAPAGINPPGYPPAPGYPGYPPAPVGPVHRRHRRHRR